MPPIQLVWFKRDLRVRDHAALASAAARGPVLPLFIYEPEQLGHEEFAGQHLTYLNECLRSLSSSLGRLGAPLLIRRGEAVQVLEGIRAELEAAGVTVGALWAHQETHNWVSFQRDLRVHEWAKRHGIPFHEPPQNGVFRRMKNRDHWAEAKEERLSQPEHPVPTLQPAPEGVRQLASTGILPHARLGVPPCTHIIPQGGEEAAHDILHGFLTSRGAGYMWEMSSPLTADTSCSRLSAPLAFGTISLRVALAETRRTLARATADPRGDPRWPRSLRSFESRLHWHDHFIQRLETEPQMEFRNLNPAFDGLREPHWNAEYFDRWAAGQTGYPMIDACMRMLRETGWLNFRMRAMLVSFASHHLWLHWRGTGLHLAQHWLDNEPGIHWAQMQMQSGTVGINRLRIYSPTRQGGDQDPNGDFIRRWVPELEGVPAPYIHRPWDLPPMTARSLGFSLGRSYPLPIVEEHAPAREARRRIEAVRARPDFREQAARVYAVHGSRKKAVRRAERVARGLPPKPTRPVPKPKAPTRRHPMTDQPSLFDPAESTPAVSLPNDWGEVLREAVSRPSFRRLLEFVEEERRTQTVFPPQEDVFNALALTPYENVKVVILGQDPYHGAGQAHGLAFSVRRGVHIPPSLRNIYTELQEDVGVQPPRHGNLEAWARQGVLLLNTSLTVRAGEAGSHAGHGWEDFTDAVIAAVNAKSERVVFVLWGAHARKKKKLVTAPQHVVIESGHPSPLSVRYFAGTRPFSAVNAALEEAGRGALDWGLGH